MYGTRNYKRLVIYFNAFVTGAVVMALEMTGSRFLTPFFGSSVFTWASIITMVLLSLSTGYFIGGSLAEKRPSSFYPGALIFIAAIFILFIPLYYTRLFNFLYDFIPDVNAGGFIGAFITLFLPLLMLGVYSPYSVKLGSLDSSLVGQVSGSLYAVSTVGSIAGTLGVTFILMPLIGIKTITVILSLICAISGFSLMLITTEVRSRQDHGDISKRKITVSLIALYVLLFFSVVFWDHFVNPPGKASGVQGEILEEVDSEYNHILIRQKNDHITMSFNHNGGVYQESSMSIINDKELPLSYTRIMPVGLLYSRNPANLLMIGLGGGSVTGYLQSYLKDISITGVELDNKVIDLAKKYFGQREKENYRIIIEDGRIFLHGSKDKYDIIMLDAYKGGSIPFHLCTQEFYIQVEQHLADSGCVVLNLQRGSKLFGSIILTLATVFDNVDLYAYETKGNAVAVAYNGPVKTSGELEAAADTLQSEYNFYYNIRDLTGLRFTYETTRQATILTDDFAPVSFLDAIDEQNEKKASRRQR